MNKPANSELWVFKKGYTLLLLLFFLLSYLLPLGARDLVDPDETRYAEIPREMIADGDWVSPHLNGVRYFEKPVLGYWAHATSLLVFGENNFAVRLPSALAAGLSALILYLIVRRTSRNKSNEEDPSAILAALIFLSSFEVVGVGNTAVLDSLFSFFLTATIAAFYFATEEPPGSAKERVFLLLSGVACGLTLMTKGFLAFALPVITFVPYLLWQRRYFDVLRMAWLPIVAALLTTLPWGIWIHLREPDFWHYFFWNEHVRRFLAENAQHKKPFWYFFTAAPVMFLPWSFVVPAAFPGIKELMNKEELQGRLIRFSLCWLVFPFLFFSSSSGKLLAYILPCFPPFAVLMALALLHVLQKKPQNVYFRRGVLACAILFGLALLLFLYVQFVGHKGVPIPYSQGWKPVAASIGIIFFITLCILSRRSLDRRKKILLFGMAPLLLFFVGHYLTLDKTIKRKVPGRLLEKYAHKIGNEDIIISHGNTTRAVCWYLKRSDVYVLEVPDELWYGLGQKDAKHRLLDMKSAADLINQNRGKTVVIARAETISQWRDKFPKPLFEDHYGRYMLLKY